MIHQSTIRRFECRYHRNGIAGTGFFLCRFRWRDGAIWRDMQAVVLPLEDESPHTTSGQCFVTSTGLDERWRGDDFEPAIRAAIATFGDKAFGLPIVVGPSL